MMRPLHTLLLLAALLAGCGRSGVRFVVECRGLNPGQTYYLSPENDASRYWLRSEADRQGVVRFKGRMAMPMPAVLCDNVGITVASLYLESGQVSLCPAAGEAPHGTPSNDALTAFAAAGDSLLMYYMTFPEVSDSLTACYQLQADSLRQALWQNNTDKILGAHLFAGKYMYAMSDSELREWFERFPEWLRQHPCMNAVREKLAE